MLVSGPSHASSFTLNPDGSFTYVHDGNGFATDSFTYKANDGLVDSNIVTVTITVTSVNDAPSFVSGARRHGAGRQRRAHSAAWATAINTGGPEESGADADLRTSPTTPIPGCSPAAGCRRWTATTGTLTFTPAANAFGTATITLRLDDDGGTAERRR